MKFIERIFSKQIRSFEPPLPAVPTLQAPIRIKPDMSTEIEVTWSIERQNEVWRQQRAKSLGLEEITRNIHETAEGISSPPTRDPAHTEIDRISKSHQILQPQSGVDLGRFKTDMAKLGEDLKGIGFGEVGYEYVKDLIKRNQGVYINKINSPLPTNVKVVHTPENVTYGGSRISRTYYFGDAAVVYGLPEPDRMKEIESRV